MLEQAGWVRAHEPDLAHTRKHQQNSYLGHIYYDIIQDEYERHYIYYFVVNNLWPSKSVAILDGYFFMLTTVSILSAE